MLMLMRNPKLGRRALCLGDTSICLRMLSELVLCLLMHHNQKADLCMQYSRQYLCMGVPPRTPLQRLRKEYHWHHLRRT